MANYCYSEMLKKERAELFKDSKIVDCGMSELTRPGHTERAESERWVDG